MEEERPKPPEWKIIYTKLTCPSPGVTLEMAVDIVIKKRDPGIFFYFDDTVYSVWQNLKVFSGTVMRGEQVDGISGFQLTSIDSFIRARSYCQDRTSVDFGLHLTCNQTPTETKPRFFLTFLEDVTFPDKEIDRFYIEHAGFRNGFETETETL